ncbi:hypothetical protein [Orrella dioscoreae]|uniref:hypothetical protein n=1 Tax=Orrella dioscoreae TaxID=1851544 RepID=UPI00083614BC|nr:hypothetical protein [Orrella dioscoreae]
MPIDLTPQQLAGLSKIDAHNFVLGVQQDLLRAYPGLPQAGLTERLAAARDMGIDIDADLVEFLKTEALAPGFYTQPGFRRWIAKPGRPAEQRFHDYMQVMRWQTRRAAQGSNKE